jgi:ribosomal protein S18 acetylase RimI-like enzyme
MTPRLQIRPYGPDDEEALIGLWRDCKLLAPQNDPRKDIRRKLRVNPEWFLIGELDGRLVASCMVGYDGHRGWINYLAVSPHAQRRGLATQLVAEAERLLREAGCLKINLQIRKTNLEVIAFYESIGFKIDEVASMGKRLEIDAGECPSTKAAPAT